MYFLHPYFLWALGFLAIPIIVHLYNLRKYKKEYFSNTSILKSIVNETKKTSKLKKRLILTSRLLTLFFLILAFAQPFFDKKNHSNSGLPIFSIYIDNSQSMESPSSQLKAIDEAKSKATEIVQTAQNQAQFQILTNDFKGNELQPVNYADAIDLIKNIEISSTKKSTKDIWEKQVKTSASNPSLKQFIWISDFQKHQVKSINQNNFNLTCIPIVHNRLTNIYIDTAYLNASVIKLNQDLKLIVKLKKSKDDIAEKSLLTVTLNNQLKTRKEISWNQNQTIIDSFNLKLVNHNWQDLKIQISDPSIEFDNSYFFSFYIPEKPYISWIGSGADQKFISNAFRADENFDIHSFSNFNLSTEEIAKSNLILINQPPDLSEAFLINKWLASNKNILMTLPPNINLSTFNKGLSSIGLPSISQINSNPTKIKQVNTQDQVLKDVFLNIDPQTDFPNFQSHYLFQGYGYRIKTSLINFENGMPFLAKFSKLGEGNLYLFTSPISPSTSDFVYSSMFAPILFKLASSDLNSISNTYLISDKSQIKLAIKEQNQDQVFTIKGERDQYIPPQKVYGTTLTFSIFNEIKESGFYQVLDNQKSKIHSIALNHSREESVMDFIKFENLAEVLEVSNLEIDKNGSSFIQKIKSFSGINIWKLWLCLAFFFLVLEMILIIYWSQISLFIKKYFD